CAKTSEASYLPNEAGNSARRVSMLSRAALKVVHADKRTKPAKGAFSLYSFRRYTGSTLPQGTGSPIMWTLETCDTVIPTDGKAIPIGGITISGSQFRKDPRTCRQW